jgi:hypothetical protein
MSPDTWNESIPDVMAALELAHNGGRQRGSAVPPYDCTAVAEMVSELTDPLEQQTTGGDCQALSAALSDAREQLGRLEKHPSRVSAGHLQSKRDEVAELEAALERAQSEEGMREWRELRALHITAEVLRRWPQGLQHPAVVAFVRDPVLKSLPSSSAEIRCKAVECLALFALLDEAAALTYLPMLLHVLDADVDAVREVAIKVRHAPRLVSPCVPHFC